MRIRLLPLCIAAAALAAAACGSDDPVTVAEPAEAVAPVTGEPVDEMAGDEIGTVVEPEIAGDATAAGTADGEPAAGGAGPGDVPDFQMVDVHSGETVNLQAVVTGEAPLLFWFWAPH